MRKASIDSVVSVQRERGTQTMAGQEGKNEKSKEGAKE
jgi:hypothetical protein